MINEVYQEIIFSQKEVYQHIWQIFNYFADKCSLSQYSNTLFPRITRLVIYTDSASSHKGLFFMQCISVRVIFTFMQFEKFADVKIAETWLVVLSSV